MLPLSKQLARMNSEQIQSLYDVLLEVGLAVESGNQDWRELFRAAKNKHHGRQGKIYTLLYEADLEAIDRMIDVLVKNP